MTAVVAKQPGPQMPRELRVLVVDDHRIFAEALAARLSADVRFGKVEVAYSAEQALALVHTHRPQVLLLDVGMGETSGIEIIDELTSARHDAVVVMVSGRTGTDEVIRAFSHGARAWIPKETTFGELVHAIEEAMMGRLWLPAALVTPVLSSLLSAPEPDELPRSFVDDLTPRQLEILDLLSNGMSRAEIARHLVLSPHTVRTHVQDILRKAGVHSTLAALAKARHAGYTDHGVHAHGSRPASRSGGRRDGPRDQLARSQGEMVSRS